MTQAQRKFVGLLCRRLGLAAFLCFAAYAWATGQSITKWRVVLEALWFTIQTITTTGYGSIPWERWGARLQALSIYLMVVAIPLWTILIGLAVSFVDQKLKKKNETIRLRVGRHLSSLKGDRWFKSRHSRLEIVELGTISNKPMG